MSRPRTIQIPPDRVTVAFVRAGGPGGQNVNKVATKVELRFVLADADWVPDAVRTRLAKMVKLTKEGEVIVTSSRHRTQNRNLKDAFDKLASLLAAAQEVPKERRPTKRSRAVQRRRLDNKSRRSALKRDRSWRPGKG